MTPRRVAAWTSFLVLGLAGISAAPPANSRTVSSSSNYVVHFDGLSEYVPCANDGVGEEVVFEGNIHVLINATIDSNGRSRFKIHSQPQGLAGLGQATGDKYQANGVTQNTDMFGDSGSVSTFVNNFHLIGQGKGNNFTVHQVFHMTFDANGELVVFTDRFTTACN